MVGSYFLNVYGITFLLYSISLYDLKNSFISKKWAHECIPVGPRGVGHKKSIFVWFSVFLNVAACDMGKMGWALELDAGSRLLPSPALLTSCQSPTPCPVFRSNQHTKKSKKKPSFRMASFCFFMGWI